MATAETADSVLAIVPARAGSKGVPGKNLRPLAGRLLIEYVLDAARQSGVVDRTILSTDSGEMAEVGRRIGMEVPFLRPAELAQDDTPMLPVIQHALGELAGRGWQPGFVVLLQPTSPLRRPLHVRQAVQLLRESGADSVVTVVEVPKHLSPDYVMRIENGALRPFLPEGARVTRRQDARAAYSRDGTVYAFRRDTVERFGSIYGDDCRPLVIPAAESLSIDTPMDWDQAERLLARKT
jgi:CMP-N,N'-diacetyllegionaminic acid synthase